MRSQDYKLITVMDTLTHTHTLTYNYTHRHTHIHATIQSTYLKTQFKLNFFIKQSTKDAIGNFGRPKLKYPCKKQNHTYIEQYSCPIFRNINSLNNSQQLKDNSTYRTMQYSILIYHDQMIRLVRIYCSVENPYETQSYIYNQTHTHRHREDLQRSIRRCAT